MLSGKDTLLLSHAPLSRGLRFYSTRYGQIICEASFEFRDVVTQPTMRLAIAPTFRLAVNPSCALGIFDAAALA